MSKERSNEHRRYRERMDPRNALLERLAQISNALDRLDRADFAGRYRLQKAADEVRSALAELLASDTVSAEWAAQAVRTLEETEFAVPVVNIDTRKEPGL